ncbi:Sterol desaturase [Enhygromyxa salina]|uniref:Sterol desaturase n=1 Tax=Enhygromyxa salina TaxID=215803 RepID=A0A0C1ZGN6_9BACT|nr:sterol desaturase family protein [Enhygromyxa salina]KIG16794.1 Sterol desaturase [Enhygromyxa salina]
MPSLLVEQLEVGLKRGWQIAGGIAEQFFSPGISVYWVYLLGAAALALLLYVVKVSRGRPTLAGALAFLFPRRIWLSRSAANDVGLFVTNALIYSFLLLVPLQAVSTGLASDTWGWLYARLGPPAQPWTGLSMRVSLTVAAFIVADLAFFLAHAAMHRVPILWEFHKVHHSATVLEPLAVFRRHPVDVIVDGIVSGLLLGPMFGVFAWASGGAFGVVSVLGTNAILFVALLLGFNLQHSEVWLSFGPLDRVFISPATHQLHHSSDVAHHDRNFGNLLAIWDRLAGTLVLPGSFAQRPRLQFGLGGEEQRMRSLPGLLVRPLIRAGLRLLVPLVPRRLRGDRLE